MTEFTSVDFQRFIDNMKQRGKRVYECGGEITISPTTGLGLKDIVDLSDLCKGGELAKWLSESQRKES